MNIFGLTFDTKNHILLENLVSKKAVYTITIYLLFLCVAAYLKHINNTPEPLWIHITV